MWWRNIYSRINSPGFCEMKSATKYWQAFSADWKDLVRSERQGEGVFLSHRSSRLPHFSLQTWFHHRASPQATAKVQDALLRCTIARDVTCWFSVCHRSCSCTHSFDLEGNLFIRRGSHTPSPNCCRSGFFQLEPGGEGEHRMCQPLFLAVGLQVYISAIQCILLEHITLVF